MASTKPMEATTDEQPATVTEQSQSSDHSCPDCGGDVTMDSAGEYQELYCRVCGLVVDEDSIDPGPEWKPAVASADESGHNTQRCVGSRDPTLHDYGLGTRYDPGLTADFDEKRRQKWAERAQTQTKLARNRRFLFGEVKRIASGLEFGYALQERACMLLRRAQDAAIFEGRWGLEAWAGAGLYAASRDMGRPVLPADVADHVRLTADDLCGDVDVEDVIRRAYGTLCRELGIGFKPVNPAAYVPRFADALETDLDPHVVVRARRLVDAATDHQEFVGRPPSTVAAAALYHAAKTMAGPKVTQGALEEVADVTPVTTRKAWQDLKTHVVDEVEEGQDGE